MRQAILFPTRKKFGSRQTIIFEGKLNFIFDFRKFSTFKSRVWTKLKKSISCPESTTPLLSPELHIEWEMPTSAKSGDGFVLIPKLQQKTTVRVWNGLKIGSEFFSKKCMTMEGWDVA